MKNLINRFILSSLIFLPSISYAYIGPGAGLSAFGALFALVAAVVIAIFGFVWYPLKRLMRKRVKVSEEPAGSDNTDGEK